MLNSMRRMEVDGDIEQIAANFHRAECLGVTRSEISDMTSWIQHDTRGSRPKTTAISYDQISRTRPTQGLEWNTYRNLLSMIGDTQGLHRACSACNVLCSDLCHSRHAGL
jgi:hypothetical protein